MKPHQSQMKKAHPGDSIVEYILPIAILITMGVLLFNNSGMTNAILGLVSQTSNGDLANRQVQVKSFGTLSPDTLIVGEQVCFKSGECFTLPPAAATPPGGESSGGNGIEEAIMNFIKALQQQQETGQSPGTNVVQAYMKHLKGDMQGLQGEMAKMEAFCIQGGANLCETDPARAAQAQLMLDGIKAQYQATLAMDFMIAKVYMNNNPQMAQSYAKEVQDLKNGLMEISSRLQAGDFSTLSQDVADLKALDGTLGQIVESLG